MDAAELRRMQRLVTEAWLHGGLCERHIGGLAWSRYHLAGREREWRTRVWEEDGDVRVGLAAAARDAGAAAPPRPARARRRRA